MKQQRQWRLGGCHATTWIWISVNRACILRGPKPQSGAFRAVQDPQILTTQTAVDQIQAFAYIGRSGPCMRLCPRFQLTDGSKACLNITTDPVQIASLRGEPTVGHCYIAQQDLVNAYRLQQTSIPVTPWIERCAKGVAAEHATERRAREAPKGKCKETLPQPLVECRSRFWRGAKPCWADVCIFLTSRNQVVGELVGFLRRLEHVHRVRVLSSGIVLEKTNGLLNRRSYLRSSYDDHQLAMKLSAACDIDTLFTT